MDSLLQLIKKFKLMKKIFLIKESLITSKNVRNVYINFFMMEVPIV